MNNSALDSDIYQSHKTLKFLSISIILEAGRIYQKLRTSLGTSFVLLNFTSNVRAYLKMCFIFYDFILQDKMLDWFIDKLLGENGVVGGANPILMYNNMCKPNQCRASIRLRRFRIYI